MRPKSENTYTSVSSSNVLPGVVALGVNDISSSARPTLSKAMRRWLVCCCGPLALWVSKLKLLMLVARRLTDVTRSLLSSCSAKSKFAADVPGPQTSADPMHAVQVLRVVGVLR